MKDIDAKQAGLWLFSILLLSLILHFGYMNMDIQGAHSWRQCQTMWNINNFSRYDINILNPRISHFNGLNGDNLNRYEFPIMQWVIGMTWRIFGESILVVRLYMFLFSSLGIIAFYRLSNHLIQNRRASVIAAYFLSVGPVYYYYSICPIPDVLALTSGIWYLYFLLRYYDDKKIQYLVLASLSLLMATLSKLPYLMFSIISIFYFFRSLINSRKLESLNLMHAFTQLLILIPAFLWYKWVMPTWSGNSIVKGVFALDLSFKEIFHIIQFNLFEVFPTSLISPMTWVFFVFGMIIYKREKERRIWVFPLILITLVYYIFEFNAIKVSHDYYLMPFLAWLYLIIAFGIQHLWQKKAKWIRYMIWFLIVAAAIFAFVSSIKKYSVEGYWKLQDAARYRTELRNIVPQDEHCLIIEDYSTYIFTYQVDKRGYVFTDPTIPLGWLSDLIRNKDVNYVYSNSRIFDENKLVQHYVQKDLLQKGNIRVLQLKTAKQITEMERILRMVSSHVILDII